MKDAQQLKLSRAELYALVWSEPLSGLAAKYRLSEITMRKICIDLSIPLPRAGHWKRVQTAGAVPAPPLPPFDGKQPFVLLSSPAAEEKPVLSARTSLDPLLVAAKQTLTEKKETSYLRDGLRHTRDGQLDIRVAPDNVDRALRFMNQFLHAARGRGHMIEGRQVVVHGQKMGICCREKLKRVSVPHSSYPQTQLVPTGVLAFQLVSRWSWQTREWKEGTETLEEKIPAILDKMELESRRLAEEEREWQIRRAAQAEEQRIQKAREEKLQIELAGFRSLITQASRWRRTLDLRSYLDAFETHARSTNTLTPDRSTWLAWARAKVDWYDPFLEAPDEWLADIDRENLAPKKTYGTY